MLAITALGAVVRWGQVQIVRPTCPQITPDPQAGCFRIWGDAVYGWWQGRMISQGIWWKDPIAWFLDPVRTVREAAGKPPLYPGGLGAIGWFGGTSQMVARAIVALVVIGLVTWVARRRLSGLGAAVTVTAAAGGLAWMAIAGAQSTNAQRLVLAACGAAAVPLIGCVGARVGGPRVGLIAAALAAVHPLLWINDGMLQVESVVALVVAWVLWSAVRYWQEPSWSQMLELAAAVAVAAQLRPEAQLFTIGVVVPVAIGAVRRSRVTWRSAAVHVALASMVCLAAWGPWLAWNQTRFVAAPPVSMTTGTGAVLVSAYCETTFEGEALGYWAAHCFDQPRPVRVKRAGDAASAIEDALGTQGIGAKLLLGGAVRRDGADAGAPPLGLGASVLVGDRLQVNLDRSLLDDSEIDAVARAQALEFAGDNTSRLPVVVAARVARTMDLFRPLDTLRIQWQVEGRPKLPSAAGLAMHWLLMVGAAIGTVILWRRKGPVAPFVGTALVVLGTTALTFGVTRYRVPLDICEIVLSAVAIGSWRGWNRFDRPARETRPVVTEENESRIPAEIEFEHGTI